MPGLAVLILNYRTAEATRQCVESVLPQLRDADFIHLLDNASGGKDVRALNELATEHPTRIVFTPQDENSGFAGGMNRLISLALANADVNRVLFLNSDAIAAPQLIGRLCGELDVDNRIELVAGKMLDAQDRSVDSLGITLFRSTLASNRKREDEILLGPSGGCALLTRRLLEDLFATHGEWFDETFFCYAEDTDLAVRARWLGYRPAYADDAVVYHARSLSSGGPDNDFVLYHGIRNSIWWLVKNAPLGWFLRSLPWFIVLHSAIWVRHLRRGKARVLWRLYRDAIKGIPAMRRKRAIIKKTRRVPAGEFSSWVEPHFYQRDYTRRAWKELFKPAPKR
jgi:GT2 family glycosyltransferase